MLADAQGEPGDLALRAIAAFEHMALFSCGGNDNRNGSRLKSYGRILNGFYAWRGERLEIGHFLKVESVPRSMASMAAICLRISCLVEVFLVTILQVTMAQKNKLHFLTHKNFVSHPFQTIELHFIWIRIKLLAC